MTKYTTFHGMRFCRDEATGYYRNGTHQKLAHRWVWENERGTIPDGWHIHHIDRDRGNNDIENLLCLSAEAHKELHISEDLTFERRSQQAAWFKKHVHPKAKDWHQSDAGRAWHKIHAIEVSANMKPKDFTCAHCGAPFTALPYGAVKFCTNKCKSAARRASGVDNIERICAVCSNPFHTTKYVKQATCSKSCANRRRDSIGAMTATAFNRR